MCVRLHHAFGDTLFDCEKQNKSLFFTHDERRNERTMKNNISLWVTLSNRMSISHIFIIRTLEGLLTNNLCMLSMVPSSTKNNIEPWKMKKCCLQNCLRGEPLMIKQNLLLISANYSITTAALQARYHNQNACAVSSIRTSYVAAIQLPVRLSSDVSTLTQFLSIDIILLYWMTKIE